MEKLVKGIRTIQYKFYKQIIVYEKLLNPLEDRELSGFYLENLSMEALQTMEVKYKEELSEKKKALLKMRLQENSSVIPFVIKDKEGQIYGYYHADEKETVNTRFSYAVKNPAGTVYFFDDYTFSGFRKKGAHNASIILRLALYRKKGYQIATVQIMPENKASIRVYEACGFRPVGAIRRMKMGQRVIIKEQMNS